MVCRTLCRVGRCGEKKGREQTWCVRRKLLFAPSAIGYTHLYLQIRYIYKNTSHNVRAMDRQFEWDGSESLRKLSLIHI